MKGCESHEKTMKKWRINPRKNGDFNDLKQEK